MKIKLFDTCVLLIALSLIFSLFGVLAIDPIPTVEEPEPQVEEIIVEAPRATPTPTPTPEIEVSEPVVPEALLVIQEINRQMGQVTMTCSRLVFGNEYRVFLTAYCAEECGWNYSTSSGTICHRSNWVYRNYEPTTCAIDLRYFRYGTLFYVPSEDRVYIAEDTGPGVVGMWIDTYQEDMSDVYGYNTRYETVYTVDIEYYEVQMSNYDVRFYIYEQLRYLPEC